jgi:hypothetical protein
MADVQGKRPISVTDEMYEEVRYLRRQFEKLGKIIRTLGRHPR